MTEFNTVEPVPPVWWAWQFDGTQASVDVFNERTGFIEGQTIMFVSDTEARYGMIGIPVTLAMVFVMQADAAGNTSISYYDDMATAEQFYSIAA